MNFNLSITPEEYLKRYENGQSDMSVASDLGITRYHISKLRTLSRKKINKISE
jgi:DNA-directed RNA polymerase subunit N (RpoN/RPB10)